MSLPFADESFDAVTVAFGLRNMPSYPAALGEMLRVLRPAGTLVCLETTPLQAPVLRAIFDWYFARVVPIVGGTLSGDADAYRYLPASAAAFPDADALGQMMLEAGFSNVRYLRRGLGTVALHVAAKAGVAADCTNGERRLSALGAGHRGVFAPRQQRSLDETDCGEQAGAHDGEQDDRRHHSRRLELSDSADHQIS